MTIVGATGHQDIPAGARKFIQARLRECLRTGHFTSGYTCLAKGADQLFAAELLRCGADLHVIVPSRDYERTFSDQDLQQYRELLTQASKVIQCGLSEASEEAFWHAGKAIVDHSDRIIAVWDGAPAGGLGGTGDVVNYARALSKPVTVIWPLGVRRF